MARRKILKKKRVYTCLICGFSYRSKQWAQKCGQWCRANKSCNLKITKHSISK